MLAIERRRKIISFLEEKSSVTVTELSRIFNITEETVRRDLEKLENEGLLKRTYGGAVAVENTNIELPFKIREVTNIEGKQLIGRTAAEYVNDGDTIALDSSTTALQVAKNIKNKKRITVITNSMNVAYELSGVKDFTVISTGGTLRPGSMSFVGRLAEEAIKKYNVDKAIISCKGIHLDRGITESNEAEAEVKKAMAEAADKVYLLIDSTKFNKISFVKMLGFEDIDILITDKELAGAWQHIGENENLKIIYSKVYS